MATNIVSTVTHSITDYGIREQLRVYKSHIQNYLEYIQICYCTGSHSLYIPDDFLFSIEECGFNVVDGIWEITRMKEYSGKYHDYV